MKVIAQRGEQYLLVPDEAEPSDDVEGTITDGETTDEVDPQAALARGYWQEPDTDDPEEVLPGDELAEKMVDFVKQLGGATMEEINLLLKEKVYVEDPKEVPQGAQVQEGDRGGLYYDTDDVEEFNEAMVKTLEGVLNEYQFEEEQIDKAEALRDEYEDVADEHFATLMDAASEHIEGGAHRVKTTASMLEKAYAREDSSAEDVDELGDVYGAMLFADSWESVEDTAEAIKDQLGQDAIIEEENMMDNDGYYRAYHLDVEFENGHQGEIQIKSQPMAEIIHVGHKLVYKDETDMNLQPEVIDQVEQCLTDQMDSLMGGPEPDCDPEVTEVIQEVMG